MMTGSHKYFVQSQASAANHDSPHDQTPEDGAEGADKEQSGKDSSVGKRDDIEVCIRQGVRLDATCVPQM